ALPFAGQNEAANTEGLLSPRLFDAPDLASDTRRIEPRLLRDVRTVIGEVGKRAQELVADLYPRNANGRLPWAYLWAITIPCDQCKNRFPLIGSLVLRHPYNRTGDEGQALLLISENGHWHTEVIEGRRPAS